MSAQKKKRAPGQQLLQIPPDFDKQWGRSDVIIMANGETKRSLHVSKTVLATFSPVFNAMFFGDFAEAQQDVVPLDIEYDVMKEILKVIHSVNRNYGQNGHALYLAEMLVKLYRAGDAFDLPMIRDLCKQQFVQIAPKEAFEVTIELELYEEKSKILKKMSFPDIQAFLEKKGTSLVLSASDMAEIVTKTQEYEKSRNSFYVEKENPGNSNYNNLFEDGY